MSISTALARVFARKAQVLSWHWVPDNHVVDGQLRTVAAEAPFVAGDDYVVLRLSEMYLKAARLLWRDRYPVVHAFITHGAPQRSITMVAGPGQLTDLGVANLDRLIGLSYRLAGPIVYDGQDIDVLAGLYAVPAKDGAKPLLDTLAQLAGLLPALGQLDQFAGVLKTGVEGLLGIDNTELVLGVRDTFKPVGTGQGRIAKPGFVVAINAPEAALDPEQLWIKEGRLYLGDNPPTARPFDAHDMMLFELHRGASRVATFATLPSLAACVQELDDILRNTADAELKPKINASFRAFEAALRASRELTGPDMAAIRALVATDLKKRVEAAMNGNLFEIREMAGAPTQIEMRSFDVRSLEMPKDASMPTRPEAQPVF